MNIFRLIFQNLCGGTVSYTLPHEHQCTSNQYRGLIVNDPTLCVGCGQCAYVCPSAAIEVKRSGDHYSWTYDAAKCAFCGRCIERCKPHSITMESQLPPLYSKPEDLKVVQNMERKRPVRPPVAPAAKPAEAPVAVKAEVPAAPTAQSAQPATPAESSPRKEELA
jgi:formate hydrogenlyase subunit 6/NADH:ubiquinone oxidoreductase subunit I